MRRRASAAGGFALLATIPWLVGGSVGKAGTAASSPWPDAAIESKLGARQMYRQRVWSREHGLPHGCILSLCQTRDGLLWIGTRKGLVCFDGIECVRLLRRQIPALLPIMLTLYADDEWIFGSLQAGAVGYLLKRSTPEQIREAIREVRRAREPDASPSSAGFLADSGRSTDQARMGRHG